MKKTILIFLFFLILLPIFADDPARDNRPLGDWSGYVYNANTGEPVFNAQIILSTNSFSRDDEEDITRETYTEYTNEEGYFEFLFTDVNVYYLRIRKLMHYDLFDVVSIIGGTNEPSEFLLQKAVGCNYNAYFVLDQYYYEASWNIQNADSGSFYFGADQTFSSEESVRYFLYLEPGTWTFLLHDSFGDGGWGCTVNTAAGIVVHEEYISGSELEFDIVVPEISGCSCSNPIEYLDINDPPKTGECADTQEIWYKFYLDNTYTDVTVSLLNSLFDTALEIWEYCGDDNYMAYNDNWQGAEQSRIDFESLDPGFYYAKIYPGGDDPGYYEIEITGDISLQNGNLEGYVYNSVSLDPIEGAVVEIYLAEARESSRLYTTTDAEGIFQFNDLAITTYDVYCSATLYLDYETQITIVEGTNYIDLPMEPFTNWNTHLALTVDSWETEASYNLLMPEEQGWFWATDQTFASEYQTRNHWINLEPGYYEVYCWDTYNDGGIAGVVEDNNGNLLISWDDEAYYSEGIFGFYVSGDVFYGDVDANGFVEAYDASNVLQYVVYLEPDAVPLPWDEETISRANVDGNDFIGAYDASLILQYVAGYIDIFPVEEMVRHQTPEAGVEITFVDNELVFTATGDLYGFEAEISSTIGTPETNILCFLNGNKLALASAEVLIGEFLRIPVSADEVTINMVINNATERLDLTSEPAPIPAVTSLKSNYPNPFNPITTIAYDVAEAGYVLIQVYNVKGQLVTTLLNEQKDPGAYTLQWNADGQASGVYFYKMKFGRYTSTKKMILMK